MPRQNLPAPVRCRARSKRSGEQCRRWSKPGALVCSIHGGGAPQVRSAANVAVMVETVAALESRPVWQVLLDAVHIADQRMIKSGDMEAVRLAAGLASEAIKAKAHEQQAQAAQAYAPAPCPDDESILGRVGVVLDAVILMAWPRRPEMIVWAQDAAAAVLLGEVPPLPPPERLAIGPARPPERPDFRRVPDGPPEPASGSSDRTAPLRPASAVAAAELHGRSSEPVTAGEQRRYLTSIGLDPASRSIIPGGDRR